MLAVDHVNLVVEKQEVHGIIGRNGAGKSVLVSMIAGVIPPSQGRVLVGGGVLDTHHSSPSLAHSLGVSLIPQEPKFAPGLSVTDNLFMGRHLTGRLNFIRPKEMRLKVEEILQRLSLKTSPTDPMGDLSIEHQQLLAFGKALFVDRAKVILLDEITASLTRERKAMLLRFLQEATAERKDISFTLISHRISEVLEFTDRVTVMRDGKAVATIRTAETTKAALAKWIVGDSPTVSISVPAAKKREKSNGPALLEVRHLKNREKTPRPLFFRRSK